jgi:hypothetical protein
MEVFMPVVSMMHVSGDADDLAARANEHLRPVAGRLAEKHGLLATIIAREEGGLLLINLWEGEEGRHAMAEEPEVQEAVRAAGFPEPRFEGHEVIDMVVTDRAVTTATA